MQAFDSSLLLVRGTFSVMDHNFFSIFQPIFNTFTTVAGLPDTILLEWETKGVSNEKVKPPIAANHSLSPKH